VLRLLVLATEQAKVGSRLRLASGGNALLSKLSPKFARVAAARGLRNQQHEINLTAILGNNTPLVYYSSPQLSFRISFAPPLLLSSFATIGRIAYCIWSSLRRRKYPRPNFSNNHKYHHIHRGEGWPCPWQIQCSEAQDVAQPTPCSAALIPWASTLAQPTPPCMDLLLPFLLNLHLLLAIPLPQGLQVLLWSARVSTPNHLQHRLARL